MASKSFERFYYEKIALGEGCGCAEQIIGTRDLERRAQETAMDGVSDVDRGSPLAWFGRLFRRHGRGALKPES